MAGAIGNSRALCLRKGWVEPACVWAVTVADSGGHKSPAYAAATSPLLELQMDLFDAHREAVQEYNTRLSEWKDAPKGERGERPEPPDDCPVFVTGDTTIEALGEVLRDNPRGVLVSRDELDGWFCSFTRYKGKAGGSDRAAWLELHRAGTLLVERLTRERGRLAVRRALVSVAGTIQPGTLARALDADALQAGLGARFLLAMPPKRRRVWTEAEVPDDLVERYQGLLKSLLALELADVPKRRPQVLGLSRSAKDVWVPYYNDWGQTQHAAEGEQAACFAKIEAYAARLMLLHHVVAMAAAGVDDRRPVVEASACAGIQLARWFANEATRVYAILRETEEEKATRSLVGWIQPQCGRVTAKQLQRSNARKYPDAGAANAALDGLVQSGLGRWEDAPTTARGGRPTRSFVLHMAPDETDETPRDCDEDDPPPWSSPSDETSDETPPGPGNPVVSGVSSVSSDAESKTHCDFDQREETLRGKGVSSDAYMLIDRAERLPAVLAALAEADSVALDLETTGLDPRRDRVRLLSLGLPTSDVGSFVYLLDLFALEPAPVFEALAGKEIVGHNLYFDLSFLARLDFVPCGRLRCTMTRSRLLYAGLRERHGLKDCLRRELGADVSKEMQAADWAGPLAEEHLAYAAGDVLRLQELLAAIARKAAEAGLAAAVEIEDRCLPAVAWMSACGVGVDRQAWLALVVAAEQEAARLKWEMAELAPVRPGEIFAAWHFDSAQDTRAMFRALGFAVEGTGDEVLATIDHPIARMLRDYRAATKKTGTYGRDWLKHVADDGRVYPGWNQTGSEAGRMSCSHPNMQQLPRDKAYRRCVVAPPGRVLVKAYYSQIELRIAAKVSGDQALLDAFAKGADVHTQTAQRVLGKLDVSKEDRQLAKALNFGLLYGMGRDRFRENARAEYGLDLSEGQAGRYRDAFFSAYPGLRAWHRSVGRTGDAAIDTRTLAGRRRLGVTKFTEKLNTPVQGTGADGLKLALALLWERREQAPGAFPVLAVHDEVVVEADEDKSGVAAEWLRAAMVDAMAPLLEPVPVEVEIKVGPTWGG